MKFLIACLLVLAPAIYAQQQPAPASSAEPKGIQDNSFLVEEAYNQEFGVVQHISTFTRFWNSKDWTYTFTQEWPVDPYPKNQLSYTIPLISPGAFPAAGVGIGDVALNYRYQLVGNGQARVAVAPRLTFLLASGNSRLGRGAGGAGIQTSIPLSLVLSKHWVTHWNVGSTIVPFAKDAFGDKALTAGYNLGQSVIWLAHPRFNVMLETIWSGSESVAGPGKTQRSHNLFLSPGVRWAYNFKNGLQIVPGIGVPVGAGPSAGEKGIFIYLSFEHPYRKIPKS